VSGFVPGELRSRSSTHLPLPTDLYSRFGFLDLLQRKAAHVIQPDIVYCGGFLETKKIAALAEAHYVSVAPHNCDGPLKTIVGVHLCANIPRSSISKGLMPTK
jgi:galactonate dehydratase